jgi:predicted nucleotidyltransferase component of viral defense system
MIQLEMIKNYFPAELRENIAFQKHLLKEYLQLSILDFLSSTQYIGKVTFIGGTNLRLVKGLDRFSEDIDLDCKDFTEDEFMAMTDDVLIFLQRSGIKVEIRDRKNEQLKAFRRNLYFPELLFDLGLTGHKEERFLIKVECQDQKVSYESVMVNIKGCGFFFPFPVPSDSILCSMKLSAMLSRQKGRDFYDSMFLLSLTKPDYSFLQQKLGIHNLSELKAATEEILKTVDLNQKKRDFEHLLFNKKRSESILLVGDFFRDLK